MTTDHEAELPLTGGGRTAVSRLGKVVFRETGPWAPSVHRLLHYLEAQGFAAAPRVVEPGFDARGREMLTYIEGEFVHPGPWTEAGLVQVGTLLRQLHEATASFDPGPDAVWQPWFLREIGGPEVVIGHGDLAPWNTITRDGLPIGFIDWEYAGPVDPKVELARVCWLFAQLHDDDVAERVGLPALEIRARQLRLLVDAYGLSAAQRDGFLDTIIEVAIRETANDAVELGVTPESEGSQWGMAWRARAAAWMLRHRRTLERALG